MRTPRWFASFGVFGAVVRVKVDICASIFCYELTFAEVEFEVVLLCCGLYEAKDLLALASLCCSGEDSFVICMG